MLSRKNSFGLMLALAVAGAGLTAQASIIYWDSNGTGATGAGAAPTGTWGTNQYWNTSSTGDAGTLSTATVNTDDLYFVAGPGVASGINAYIVTVNGSQVANSLNFQASGATTISGGTLITLGDGTAGNGGINQARYAYGTTAQAAVTISTNIALNNSQTWTSATQGGSGRALTINGVISETGGTKNLTLLSRDNGITLGNAANTYSGITTFGTNGGTVSGLFTTAVLANGGVASSIGQSSNAAANLVLNNGAGNSEDVTWAYSGGSTSTDRLFTINNFRTGGSFQFRITNAVTLAFTNTNSLVIANNGSGNFNVNLGTSNSATGSTLDVTPLISNPTGAGGYTSWNALTAGTNLVLRNPNNTFSGFVVTADNGRLEFTNIANSGSISALGTGVNGTTITLTPGVANGTKTFRQVDSTAFTAFDGSGVDANSSTDRALAYSPTAGNTGTRINIENNSANRALIFDTGTFTQAGASAGIISFGGTNTGANSFKRVITNQTGTGTPTNSVRKDGTGTWILAGNNTYTGTTQVNGGTLYINGIQSTATGAVTVASTATLGGSGTIGGAVTIQSGGTLAPGNSPGTINFSGGLTIDAGGIFNWENNTVNALGAAGTNWDVANVTAGSTSISSTASTGSKLKLLFTDAGTDFTNSFWDTNRTWAFITGGVTVGNLFDASNITVFINGTQQGSNNTITGQGTFTTTISGSNLELNWAALAGNNSKLWVGGTAPTTTLQTTNVTQAFGRVMQGTTQSATVALSSSGSDVSTTSATVVASGTGISTTTGSPGLISALTTSGINATLSTASTGAKSGTITIDNQASTSFGTSQGSDNGNATISVSGTVLANRVLTATAVTLGNVRVTGTTGSQNSTITSPTGQDDQWTRVTLGAGSSNASVSGGTITLGSGTAYQFGNLNDATNSTIRGVTGTFTAAGSKSGNASFTPTGEGLASEVVNSFNVSYTAAAYDYAQANYTGTALALGNVRVGAAVPTANLTLTNTTITNASFQDNLTASATTGNAKVTATGFTEKGAGLSDNLVFSGNTTTAGSLASTATLSLNSTNTVSGLDAKVLTAGGGAVTTTGGVYDFAAAKYTGATLDFGNVHVGASPSAQTVAFGNQTITSASYQDLLDVAATTGNAKVTATGFTGLGASASGVTTDVLSFAVSSATAGSLASTASLTLTSNANGVAGLSNGTATVVGSPTAITTAGQVYSGLMIWSGASGSWGTHASWTDSTNAGVHVAPGLDGAYTGVDTATFGNTSGSVTVSLNGNSPSLNAVTFNNTGSYTIAQGSSGTLKLAGTTPTVSVTGTHYISAPIELVSNASFTAGSGSTLTVSGAIGGAGSFEKLGLGTVIFTNANTYGGGTTVTAGTLLINNTTGSGLGTGAVTVKVGAILGGAGTYSGGMTVESGATVSPGNSPGVLNTGDFTMDTGAKYDWQWDGAATPQFDQIKLASGKTLTLADGWVLNLINLSGDVINLANRTTRYYIFDTTGSSIVSSGVGTNVDITSYVSVNYGSTTWGNVKVWKDTDGVGTDGIYLLNVPEPTSLSLLGLGAAGLLLRRRRKA